MECRRPTSQVTIGAVVVLFGLSLIFGQYRARQVARGLDFLTSVAVLGGRSELSTSQTSVGGDLTAAFGGVTVKD